MVPEMYGEDIEGDDDLMGFEYTEILGDLLDGDDVEGAFVGDAIPGHTTSYGDDDIIGAAIAQRRRRKKAAAAQMLMRKRVAAGALLRGVPPRQSREFALGLGSTSVAGNSSANINVQPQVIFRPERLVVPSNLAIDFLITDIKVGKNSQLVSTGALPAVMFTEVAFGVRLKMDTCQISMFVTISVTNQNPAARNFQGGIVGPAVE